MLFCNKLHEEEATVTALETWEETWQMSFNPPKCIVLHIAPMNKKILQSEYKLHGHILETEEVSRYLESHNR